MITVMISDGKNYELWERAMTTALKAKNKLGFITGSLKRPETTNDEDFGESHAWDMANSMLYSWIVNVIDPKLRMTISYYDTAKAMWDDLRKHYGMANTPKIHQLKANIANCKQGDMDIGYFYAKLVNLWNELSNLVKVSVCTCKGCECGAVSKILAMYEADKAYQFLMGLNVSKDPLPLLDKIFIIMQQEENHKKL